MDRIDFSLRFKSLMWSFGSFLITKLILMIIIIVLWPGFISFWSTDSIESEVHDNFKAYGFVVAMSRVKLNYVSPHGQKSCKNVVQNIWPALSLTFVERFAIKTTPSPDSIHIHFEPQQFYSEPWWAHSVHRWALLWAPVSFLSPSE